MSGMLESLIRKLEQHAREWAGLPLTDVPSASCSDDDNEFVGDMRHLNNMLDKLEYLCATEDAAAKPLGPVHSTALEMWLCDVQADWPADEAEAALKVWRRQPERQPLWPHWWAVKNRHATQGRAA